MNQIGSLLQVVDSVFAEFNRVGQLVIVNKRIVANQAEVKRIFLVGDLRPREDVKPFADDCTTIISRERPFKVGKMFAAERIGHAERWHIRPQVVKPNFASIVKVARATSEEQDVCLDALGIKNFRRQSQNRVQVAFVHEVDANPFAVAVSKKNVVGQDDCGASAGLETAIKMLQEIQWLIDRREGEIVAGSAFAAFLRAKRRVTQDQVEIFQALADFGECVAENYSAVEIVQHGIHQRKSVRIVDKFATRESFGRLKNLLFLRQVKEIVGVVANDDINKDTRRKILPRAEYRFNALIVAIIFSRLVDAP